MVPDPKQLFFVVGTGRCGSTLLQAMLSSHPNLYVPPELRFFGRHDPGVHFSDPLRDEDVDAYLAGCDLDIWWRDMGMDMSAFHDAIRGGVRTSRDIYLWILAHVAVKRGNRKPRCGDKTPDYVLFVERIDELFPDSKFIQLWRDPRDVVASYLEQYWVQGGTALRVASYIRHVFREVERAAIRLGPERLCVVRYEDLVEHPERELRRLCAFLGEDYDPAMLDFGNRVDKGYLEVEEAWKGMTRGGLTSARVGRYRAKLTARQIWTVEQRLRPMLSELGYDPDATIQRRLHWYGVLWSERIYRKVLHTLGMQRALLDERAVLSRRDALMGSGERASRPVPPDRIE